MALALMLGAALALVLVLAWLASGIRVVRAEHRAVIERFGRYRRTAGPGLTLTLRFLDLVHIVDQREIVQDVTVDVLTADDIAITFEIAVFYACTRPPAVRVRHRRLPGGAEPAGGDPPAGPHPGADPRGRCWPGSTAIGQLLLRSVAEVAETWGACATRVDLVPRRAAARS